jgi:hypothetical protein
VTFDAAAARVTDDFAGLDELLTVVAVPRAAGA